MRVLLICLFNFFKNLEGVAQFVPMVFPDNPNFNLPKIRFEDIFPKSQSDTRSVKERKTSFCNSIKGLETDPCTDVVSSELG